MSQEASISLRFADRHEAGRILAERLTGYSRQEILQMRVVDLIAPEDIDRARTLMARRLAGTSSFSALRGAEFRWDSRSRRHWPCGI